MSAETLRRAAVLMRERAEAATKGPWRPDIESDGRAWVVIDDGMDSLSMHGYPSDAAHIAAWHPAVALAVADWLESVAAEHESDAGSPESVIRFFAGFVTPADHAALAVARAYLGQAS